MYGLIGQLETQSDARDKLAEILAGMGEMPGCISYIVAHDSTSPDTLWVTEVWESKQAHAESLQLHAVQEAIAKGRPLIAGFATRIETAPSEASGSASRQQVVDLAQ